MKQFYNVDLSKQDAEKLKQFLKICGFYFEPSSFYNLVHFEIKLTESEVKLVNDFLKNL